VCSDTNEEVAKSVLSARLATMAPNVTLSYEQPILMERASGSKMYDQHGSEWLDCVNNVAHVGHCNPLVRTAHGQASPAHHAHSMLLFEFNHKLSCEK
jgi:4-aminobutyrate aminotransferase-like enzyme